jgi:hypothetical protein
MKAKIKAQKPDEIEMELTLTMRLKDWKELRSQVQQAWPSWEVGSAISDLINQAEKHFYPKPTDE